jgi:hypothetical protein
MRKTMFLTGVILLVPFLTAHITQTAKKEPTPQPITPIAPTPIKTDSLVVALIQVESRGNDSAYCKSEEAVGCLQIRPIMVREVNRILKIQGKENRFKLKDRWDREKSLEMFYVWKAFHHPNSTNEQIARNWNGGPKGYQRKSTIKYWTKVEQQLNQNGEN